jgi:hypothetical protein
MAITITPDELKKSAVKYKKDLLMMITIGLESSLKHMSPRLGVQYKESWGEIGGSSELGPYDPTRKDTTVAVNGRTLEVFLGSIIKEFDPNQVWQSIYGSLVLNGTALKDVEITKAILAAEMKKISQKLNMAIFSAVRSDAGTTSQALFNGFDTIAQTEITATKITTEIGNLFQFPSAITNLNAVDQLKAMYRAAKDELQGEKTKLFVSKDIYNNYVDDYQSTVGSVPYNREFKKTFLEGSDDLCEFVALPNKKNSPFIQLTTKSNMIVGCGADEGIERMEVDRFSSFLITLSLAKVFGVQYETISPERILIGKLYTA